MIKEYIAERRIENIRKKNELEKKYNDLVERENEIKLKINKIKQESQIGFDLFSPRSFERMSKTHIYEVEEELKNIILKKQELKRQIREKEKMVRKIEQMEEEIEEENQLEDQEKIELPKEKVGDMVKILDECLRLMYNDRNTCKTELKQIKKYLKSFIKQ